MKKNNCKFISIHLEFLIFSFIHHMLRQKWRGHIHDISILTRGGTLPPPPPPPDATCLWCVHTERFYLEAYSIYSGVFSWSQFGLVHCLARKNYEWDISWPALPAEISIMVAPLNKDRYYHHRSNEYILQLYFFRNYCRGVRNHCL